MLKQFLQVVTEGLCERRETAFRKQFSRTGPVTVIPWEFKHEIIQPEISVAGFLGSPVVGPELVRVGDGGILRR